MKFFDGINDVLEGSMRLEVPIDAEPITYTPTATGVQITVPADCVTLTVDNVQVPRPFFAHAIHYVEGWRDGAKRGLRIAKQFPDPGIVFPTGLEGEALKAWMQGHADAYENVGVNRGIIEAAKPVLESIESGEAN